MSWFKTFNKASWELRVFRGVNLKFAQDEMSGTKCMHNNWWKDFLWKIFRSNEAQRCYMMYLVLGLGLSYSAASYRETTAEEVAAGKAAHQKTLDEEEELRKRLFVNRFGANTQPLRSIDEMVEFITSLTLLDNTMDYVGHPDASEITEDYQKGLDSWISDEDRKMVKYWQRRRDAGSH